MIGLKLTEEEAEREPCYELPLLGPVHCWPEEAEPGDSCQCGREVLMAEHYMRFQRGDL